MAAAFLAGAFFTAAFLAGAAFFTAAFLAGAAALAGATFLAAAFFGAAFFVAAILILLESGVLLGLGYELSEVFNAAAAVNFILERAGTCTIPPVDGFRVSRAGDCVTVK